MKLLNERGTYYWIGMSVSAVLVVGFFTLPEPYALDMVSLGFAWIAACSAFGHYDYPHSPEPLKPLGELLKNALVVCVSIGGVVWLGTGDHALGAEYFLKLFIGSFIGIKAVMYYRRRDPDLHTYKAHIEEELAAFETHAAELEDEWNRAKERTTAPDTKKP